MTIECNYLRDHYKSEFDNQQVFFCDHTDAQRSSENTNDKCPMVDAGECLVEGGPFND